MSILLALAGCAQPTDPMTLTYEVTTAGTTNDGTPLTNQDLQGIAFTLEPALWRDDRPLDRIEEFNSYAIIARGYEDDVEINDLFKTPHPIFASSPIIFEENCLDGHACQYHLQIYHDAIEGSDTSLDTLSITETFVPGAQMYCLTELTLTDAVIVDGELIEASSMTAPEPTCTIDSVQ